MKRLTIAAIAAALAQFAGAETWYWSPSVQTTLSNGSKVYAWQDTHNWTNAAATRGVPVSGDTAVLGWGTAGSGPYNVCGNNTANVLREVRFEGAKTIGLNQGNLVLQGGGGGLQFLRDADNVNNWMGCFLVGDGEVPFNIAYNRSFALQMRMKKSGNGNPTLVKTGPGKFICFNQAGGDGYTIPLTLIRQGAYDITTASTLDGVTIAFDGNDESQRITYCYRSGDLLDLKLKNIGFYETNGVANTAHGFSSQNDNQVKFTGTPKQNPTVFSGTFYSKSGLNWAPDSASYTFVCSNAVSATRGSVIVTKGTVKLVTGASFSALSKLDVAAGATFDVEEGSGANFHADALTLGNATAKLKLGTGVTLTVGTATLNGNPLPHGTYTADGANGTRTAAWIEGVGSVVVENGPDSIDVWSGGGADNLATTDANWESGAAPDITAGDLVATFAKGGTVAELPAGTAAAFEGVVLDSANLGGNAFAFTAGSGASASIGASALTAIAAPSAATWTMGWPITLAGGAQTWNVGTNNTVKFNAPIGGTQNLTFAGSGTVELNVDNTHSGSLLFDSGTFKMTTGGALGSSARTVDYYYDRASLAFDGNFTVDTPIHGTSLTYLKSSAGGLNVTAGSDVTFNRQVSNKAYMWVNARAGGTATFKNGLTITADGMDGHLSVGGGGTLIVTNVAANIAQKTMVNGGTTLDLRVSGNRLSAGNTYWMDITSGTLVTRVSNALISGPMIYLGASGTFDLDGHSQSIATLQGAAGGMLVSSRPATLTLLCNQNGISQDNNNGNGVYGPEGRTNRVVFVGNVSLVKQGSLQHTLAADSSSTGTLKVTNGTLTLSGSWANCTNLVAAGGTFAVKNVNAFGDNLRAPGESPKVEVDVTSGASLVLDYAGHIDCAAFRLGGTKLYGTFGAPGSGADNEYAWISGTGLMRVLPKGTTIIFR